MYIHPFLAGVIATILAEMLLLIVSVIHSTNKYDKKRRGNSEESQDANL